MPTPTIVPGAPTDVIAQNPDLLSTNDSTAPPPDPLKDEERNELFDFPTIKSRLTNLINKHDSTVKVVTEENKRQRFIDVKVDLEKYKDRLKNNDILVLVRTIDTNIRREQPPFISYLKQPDRVATFTQIDDPSVNTADIEAEFTRGVTYANWEIPIMKAQDSGACHGWGFIEVVFDESKPFHVGTEHIETSKLIFHEDTTDIQNQEIIIREYSVVAKQLKSWVTRYEFNPAEVDRLTKDLKNEDKDKSICIYKKFCKYDGTVYVSWFSPKCENWLKAPEPLYLGRDTLETKITQVPNVVGINPDGSPIVENTPTPTQVLNSIPESMYPIYIYEYELTELPKILDHKGRVFKDRFKQEAMTANLSAYISSCLLASDLIVSPKSPVDQPSKLENYEHRHGKAAPIPMDYTHVDYPDSGMLKLAEYLEAFNAEDAGRPSYAVQQKSAGSRVTAEQIKSARQDQTQLTSLQVSTFSSFVRNILSRIWEIVQNRAINGKITFLQVVGPDGELTNDISRIQLNYDVRSAGDTDVVRKNELLSLYLQFWPIVAQTAAAPLFLVKMLKLAFGAEGSDFISILSGADPRVILMAILDILKVSLDADEIPVDPQSRAQLTNLILQAEQVVAPLRQQQAQKNQLGAAQQNPQPAPQPESEIA